MEDPFVGLLKSIEASGMLDLDDLAVGMAKCLKAIDGEAVAARKVFLFILTASMPSNAEQVELPSPSSTPDHFSRAVLELPADGRWILNGNELETDQLLELLDQVKADEHISAVEIRADKSLSAEGLVQAIAVIKKRNCRW